MSFSFFIVLEGANWIFISIWTLKQIYKNSWSTRNNFSMYILLIEQKKPWINYSRPFANVVVQPPTQQNGYFKKIYLKFLWHITRKQGWENLTLTRYVEENRERENQCIAEWTNLCNWLAEQRLGVISKR